MHTWDHTLLNFHSLDRLLHQDNNMYNGDLVYVHVDPDESKTNVDYYSISIALSIGILLPFKMAIIKASSKPRLTTYFLACLAISEFYCNTTDMHL